MVETSAADWRWPGIIAGSMAACLVWAAAIRIGGNIGLLAPAVLPIFLAAGFIFWRAAQGAQWAVNAILLIVACLLSANFRTRTMGDVGLDWQNGSKILVWGGMLAIGLLNYKRLIPFLADRVIATFTCFIAICILSTAVSPTPIITATSSIGAAAYLVFACYVAAVLPERVSLRVLLYGFVIFCCVSFIAGLVAPDLAFMRTDPKTDIYRFQGITGQPNQLGRIGSVFALVVIAAAYRKYLRPWVWLPMLTIAVATILLTESRTALLSILLAGALQLPRKYIVPVALFIGLVAFAVIAAGQLEAVMSLLGRDGSASDAESMAGRTDLWKFTWDLIRQRPIMGYGFGSFEAYANLVWTGDSYAAVVATHNNYLSVMYSTGILGLIPFLTAVGLLLSRWMFQPDFPRDIFVINAMIYGFSESDIPSIAAIPTSVFFLLLAYDARRTAQNA